MKVVVTGGRKYSNRAFVFAVLDTLHELETITRLCEGGAGGADKWAREWRNERGVDGETYEANWDYVTAPDAVVKKNKYGEYYNAKAGSTRNHVMLLSEQPDCVVKFPGGYGTDDCVSRANDFRILVIDAESLRVDSK